MEVPPFLGFVISDARADWLSAAKGGGAARAKDRLPPTMSRVAQVQEVCKLCEEGIDLDRATETFRFLRRSFAVTRCKIVLILFIREVQKTEM